jgi:hypothetical protein
LRAEPCSFLRSGARAIGSSPHLGCVGPTDPSPGRAPRLSGLPTVCRLSPRRGCGIRERGDGARGLSCGVSRGERQVQLLALALASVVLTASSLADRTGRRADRIVDHDLSSRAATGVTGKKRVTSRKRAALWSRQDAPPRDGIRHGRPLLASAPRLASGSSPLSPEGRRLRFRATARQVEIHSPTMPD